MSRVDEIVFAFRTSQQVVHADLDLILVPIAEFASDGIHSHNEVLEMSSDFEMLMQHLAERTGDVELNTTSPQASSSEAIAADLAQRRMRGIRKGERVAYLFPLKDGARMRWPDGSETGHSIETGVTAAECRELVAAGAKWVGASNRVPLPYIQEIRVRDFGCVRDVSIPLTPLHAFVGPNDSGKSTLLSAVSKLHAVGELPTGIVSARYRDLAVTRFYVQPGSPVEFVHAIDIEPEKILRGMAAAASDQKSVELMDRLKGPARFLRLDPDEMRTPTQLIRDGEPLEFDLRGKKLAAVYDAILSKRMAVFIEIRDEFRKLFPTVAEIQLKNHSSIEKSLSVELIDGTTVDADGMSEGMLYWLAFASLPYVQPTAIALVEEPENGLHPSRIKDVVRVLREIAATTQVIIATHSPLVINELEPREVTVITRGATTGTVATPISETKNFKQRSGVYALGELWLNYADGNVEAELVSGG